MKMVIEIPEDVKAIIDRKGTNETVAETLWQAVKNGTPLQEGHSFIAICDSDFPITEEIKQELKNTVFVGDEDCRYCFDMTEIIEADVPDTDVGNNDRNCEACKHHHDGGCDSWECEEDEKE